MHKWEQDTIDAIIKDDSQMVYIRSHYWMLKVCSCVNVARDREWFNSKIPEMRDFWKDVEMYRENGGIEKLNEDIEAAAVRKKLAKGVPNADGKCLILDSGSESSSINSESTNSEVKKDNAYLIISSDEEDENEKTGLIPTSKNDEQSTPRTETISYIFSSSEDEDDFHDKIEVKLSKITLEISERQDKVKWGDTGAHYNRPTLILTPDHSSNSSSLDIDYEGDAESSGSDTDNDSPPLRPPSETRFRRWKKKKKT
jgi:hypothetical protein